MPSTAASFTTRSKTTRVWRPTVSKLKARARRPSCCARNIDREKLQRPIPKVQRNPKPQAPKLAAGGRHTHVHHHQSNARFGPWNFGLVWSLVIGIWNFYDPSSPFRSEKINSGKSRL